MKKVKIAFTGGGTGGHTTPAISIIRYLKKHSEEENIKFDFLYIGSKSGIEKDYAEKENILYKSIRTGKLRRSLNIKNISDMFKVFIGIIESYFILKNYKPDLVFSTGGYVSVPVVIASKIRSIPVIIHEQTVNVGLANKIASKFANKVAISFESSKKYFPENKVVLTGMPLREEIFTGDKNECYKIFKLDKKLPLLYVTGGSQGSKFINDKIAEILKELLQKMNIIHQCGGTAIHKSYEELQTIRNNLPIELKERYVVKDYIYDELKHIFKAANLIIGRSGAGTVNECIALSKPSIFIPLPGTTKNEQVENAKLGERLGGAIVLYQDKLGAKDLFRTIMELFSDDESLKRMSANFKNSSRKAANKNIFNLIVGLVK